MGVFFLPNWMQLVILLRCYIYLQARGKTEMLISNIFPCYTGTNAFPHRSVFIPVEKNLEIYLY